MSAGAIKAKTKRFNFSKINFDFPRWHTYEWDNWDLLDAALYSMGGFVSSGLWQNSTFYEDGVRITDANESLTYVCLTSHTSPPTGTFAEYREAFPGQWRPITAVPYYRGDFVYPTLYYSGDIAKEGYVYKLATSVSQSTADSFVDGAHWATIFDATDVITRLDQSGADATHMEELYEDFVSQYLGAYAGNPVLDPIGEPIIVGALYWNTTDNAMRVHRGGGVWDEMLDDAPQDGNQYARQSGAWAPVIAGAVISEAPPANPLPNSFWWESDSGNLYIRFNDGNSTQWVQVGGGGGGGGASTTAVLKTGDTMTGPLVLSGAPTIPLHAATKQYVDDKPSVDAYTKTESEARYVSITGETMTGDLSTTGVSAFKGDGWGTVYWGMNASNAWYFQRRPTDGYLLCNYSVSGSHTIPLQFQPNGNMWMSWANDWISNLLAAKMPYAGGEFTGKFYTTRVNSYQGTADSGSMTVRNASGSGDAGLASIGFLCEAAYGISLHLRSDGYFGIGGWSSAHWRWYSSGAGDMIAAGNIAAYSDPRLKNGVSKIEGALAIIEQLDGVRFTWNDKSKLIGRPGQRDIGVLSTQVKAVLPEIVGKSIPDTENGNVQWDTVAYDKLVPVLIEAIKELSTRVRELEAR